MKSITFYDHKKIRTDFLEDKFAAVRWFLTKFENNVRQYYHHTEFVVIDETLCNCHNSYNCDFKVYMKDKPGNYGFLLSVLADVRHHNTSQVINYVIPPPRKGKQ